MQVQRLIAVLSVPAVTRGALLSDGAPDLATGLPDADAAVLRAAGWTSESGLRSLLNFSGRLNTLKTFIPSIVSSP